ncbi:vWA domain-containing protein [Deinococcus petrolearius]|uniref:VWA domain-containing protein n=1 Tax=Deinococcus petrolearius TaxID=1751295 RepID=A0ABW1DNC1_9DEIO
MTTTKPSLKDITVAVPRPLPVLLLLDVSGSMAEDGKLAALNTAVRDMLHTFTQEQAGGAEIHVAVLAFSGREARVHVPLKPAREVKFDALEAKGHTPIGSALTLTTQILENRDLVPGRAYRPTVVLVSDGVPTDDWEGPLDRLLSSARASKAVRLALAVGEDADLEVLTRFAGEDHVRRAPEARQLRRFFKFVTMSVTARSRSATPDQVVALPDLGTDDGFDDLDL